MSTMHRLKHPIIVFVVTVLVVIGIGVGIVAATTSQRVYGPSWGRFTASFPGRVNAHHGRVSITLGGHKFPFFGYSTASSTAIFCAPGVSCYPTNLTLPLRKLSRPPPPM